MAGPYYVNYARADDTGDGLSWAAAKRTFGAARALVAAGETIYVDSTHAEPLGASTTYTFPSTGTPVFVVSATNGTTTPAAGAEIYTNGNYYLYINGMVSMYGMKLRSGTTGYQDTTAISLAYSAAADDFQFYDKCTFDLRGGTASSLFRMGYYALRSSQSALGLRNCTLVLNGVNATIRTMLSRITIENLILSGTAPTSLFALFEMANVRVSSSDLSAATNLVNAAYDDVQAIGYFSNCKLPTNVITGTPFGLGSVIVEAAGCSIGADDDSWRYWWYGPEGNVLATSSVYLTTGGASTSNHAGDAVPYSLMMTPVATIVTKGSPLYTPWISVRNTLTGSKTISIKAADTEAAVLTDAELWLEVEYLGGAATANSAQSQLETSAPVTADASSISRNFMDAGSNLTDTAEAWTGITETGTYTLSKTVTIDEPGYLRVRVGLGKTTTGPVYVNPKIAIA